MNTFSYVIRTMKKLALLLSCFFMAGCSTPPAPSNGWASIDVDLSYYSRYIRMERLNTIANPVSCYWQFHGALSFAIYDVNASYMIEGSTQR